VAARLNGGASNVVRPPHAVSGNVNALILFEDEHLLVVHKPSGINTHKPDRFTPDGLHEWLTRQKPQWRNLSILHRLDKDTSGVLVFGKSTCANQSLAEQFAGHTIVKDYLLLAAARPTRPRFRAKSTDAVTEFELIGPHAGLFLVRAQPVTGKTHQVRRHAAENGFPIVGDTLYDGEPAPRLMLHAHRITLQHPGTGRPVTFEASVPRVFDELDPLVAALEFRELIFDEQTTAFRLISGAADGFPDVVVDNYDGWLLVQWQTREAQARSEQLVDALWTSMKPRGIVEQVVARSERSTPRMLRPAGELPGKFAVRENGLTFRVQFGEGLSTGLFADQRENRWRLLSMDLRGKTALNCFAYTGAFSVAAAKAGAAVTTVDLSRNYLEWARENFSANGLSCGDSAPISVANEDDKTPALRQGSSQTAPRHDFIYGDVFDWLRRFGKRGRKWDLVLLDPPTFSKVKHRRAFQAERNYRDLAALAVPLVAADGWLFCSTNQRTLAPEKFERALLDATQQCGRIVTTLEFQTAPFDFRAPAGEHPYLKTFWAQLR
jgi:23S rRNA (cytosine1962-C5)-methyltransferase